MPRLDNPRPQAIMNQPVRMKLYQRHGVKNSEGQDPNTWVQKHPPQALRMKKLKRPTSKWPVQDPTIQIHVYKQWPSIQQEWRQAGRGLASIVNGEWLIKTEAAAWSWNDKTPMASSTVTLVWTVTWHFANCFLCSFSPDLWPALETVLKWTKLSSHLCPPSLVSTVRIAASRNCSYSFAKIEHNNQLCHQHKGSFILLDCILLS